MWGGFVGRTREGGVWKWGFGGGSGGCGDREARGKPRGGIAMATAATRKSAEGGGAAICGEVGDAG